MLPNRNEELERFVLSVESDPNVDLNVPDKLKNPHPIIKNLNTSTYYTLGFNSKTEKTRALKGSFDFEVGKSNLKRAKCILDTFIKAVEARGNSFSFESKGTYLNVFEEKIRIRFWEKSKYIDKPNKYGDRELELSGILSIQYLWINYSVEKEWSDSPNVKLEEKLGRVIGSLEYIAKKKNVERIEREKRWEAQRIERELIEEQNRLKESEFNKFKELLGSAYRWEKSQMIRAYVSFIKNSSISEEIEDWVQWANEKIDWFDPSISKQDSLLKPFGRFHQALLDGQIKIDSNNIDGL